ncbi:hypothetical protein BDZ89DRAFT_1041776 [Hymenopellis radicata]|nr:hypothetical protein BDZ89DRAFT_1041776 [Hymenopellis radicata]
MTDNIRAGLVARIVLAGGFASMKWADALRENITRLHTSRFLIPTRDIWRGLVASRDLLEKLESLAHSSPPQCEMITQIDYPKSATGTVLMFVPDTFFSPDITGHFLSTLQPTLLRVQAKLVLSTPLDTAARLVLPDTLFPDRLILLVESLHGSAIMTCPFSYTALYWNFWRVNTS